MKLNRFITVVALALLSLSLSSCNKEAEPLVLTGTWKIDTVNTALHIVYNEIYAESNPVALQFLNNNTQKMRRLLYDPQILTFGEGGSVTFNYLSTGQVIGTYTQSENFFVTVVNDFFPEGLNGASDNQTLEFYYTKPYLMTVLSSILTENDPSMDVFVQLIDVFEAKGSYMRTSY